MTYRTVLLLAATIPLLTLGGCGSGGVAPTTGTGQDAGTGTASPVVTSASAATPVDPDAELVGSGILMQTSPDAPVELCVGGIAESYPPQCGGPALAGEFDWDQVTAQEQGGTRWTDDAYWAVGHLDLADGPRGTLTLTRPLSATPPDGFTPPSSPAADFPQLCADPTADVPDVDQAARTAGAGGMEDDQALGQLTSTLPGYVTHWVSDGGPVVNLVVDASADLEATRVAIREVFTGPLCLEQRDLPSAEQVSAAQVALSGGAPELGILASYGGGVTGLLEVEVVLADQATLDAVHAAVEEWLTPAQVSVRSTFLPLDQG